MTARETTHGSHCAPRASQRCNVRPAELRRESSRTMRQPEQMLEPCLQPTICTISLRRS